MFKTSCHYIAACLILFGACKDRQNAYVPPADPLFTQMDKAQTGIGFRNDLKEDAGFNVFNYRNFYNGAGVGIGDINNDGLADDILLEIPAVGADGGPPLPGFLEGR